MSEEEKARHGLTRIPGEPGADPPEDFDYRLNVEDQGGPPVVRRIPAVRLITKLEADADGHERAIVAFPAGGTFPSRDGVDVPGEGHFRFVGDHIFVGRETYAHLVPGDVGETDELWQVDVERDQ